MLLNDKAVQCLVVGMAVETGSWNENICHIYERMIFGEEKMDLSLAKEWLKEHSSLDCWLDGAYTSHEKPVYLNYEVELRDGSKTDIRILQGAKLSSQAVHFSKKVLDSHGKYGRVVFEMLYKISTALESKRELCKQLCSLSDRDFQLIIDYFQFYSDVSAGNCEETPIGVVLLIPSHETPSWVVAMNVATALSMCCSVIIKPAIKSFFPFLLAEACKEAGVPGGFLNIITGSEETIECLLQEDVDKILVNDSSLRETLVRSKAVEISILVPNHTASIILEACDVTGAVDKLFSEMWGCGSESIWRLDAVVVQESVYLSFLDKLTSKIECSLILADDMRMKIKETLAKAKIMGAKTKNSWTPVLFSQHQLDLGVTEIPLLTLMVCRTASEAVNLVNKFSYCLATSVWTEDYAQALEIAPQLESSLVWVNCHGLIDPGVTFEPSRKSGKGRFGGFGNFEITEPLTGRFAYIEHLLPAENYREAENEEVACSGATLQKTIRKATEALAKWKSKNNRRKILKDIFYLISETKDRKRYSEIVNYWAHMGNSLQEGYAALSRLPLSDIRIKKPIGVIGIVFPDSEYIDEYFVEIVTPAIALGNTVVVLVTKENFIALEPLIDHYNRFLPFGVLNVLKDINYATELAADSNINAIWYCSHYKNSLSNKLKDISFECFKHFWIPRNPSTRRFLRYCQKEQTILLTNVHSCS